MVQKAAISNPCGASQQLKTFSQPSSIWGPFSNEGRVKAAQAGGEGWGRGIGFTFYILCRRYGRSLATH